MEKSTIIFSIIILILISLIIVLFVNISNIKKEYTDDINKIKLILEYNINTLDEMSKETNKKELILDNLKVKNLEVINNLKSPEILTDNLNSYNENSINVNNDININKDIIANPDAGLKIKLDIGDGTDKPYIGNKSNTFYMKNMNTNFLIPFKDILLKDISFNYHVSNDKLHNGNLIDENIQFMTKEEEKEDEEKENNQLDKIENFTDLLTYY